MHDIGLKGWFFFIPICNFILSLFPTDYFNKKNNYININKLSIQESNINSIEKGNVICYACGKKIFSDIYFSEFKTIKCPYCNKKLNEDNIIFE